MCSSSCNCMGCYNNHENSLTRYEVISQILSRNPDAFNIKYKNTPNNDTIYKKGCNCKKSNCLKKYCECYNACVPCSEHCKCCECKNNNIAGGQYGDEYKKEILSSVMNESPSMNFKKQKIEGKSYEPGKNDHIKSYLSPEEKITVNASLNEKRQAHSADQVNSWDYLSLLQESGKRRKEILDLNFQLAPRDDKKTFERKLDFTLETENETN